MTAEIVHLDGQQARVPAKVVGSRVDWLDVAFRVDLSRHALALLKGTATIALRDKAPAPCELADTGFECAVPRGPGRWLLKNAVCRLEVLEQAPGAEVPGDAGWNVVVRMSGTAMLHMGYQYAIQWAWLVAGALGDVMQSRFGRMDLCCDVAGYDLRAGDRAAFVKRRRVSSRDCFFDGAAVTRKRRTPRGTNGKRAAKETTVFQNSAVRVVEDREGVPLFAHYAGGTFSGFIFGSRTTITARIYDKVLQLKTQVADKFVAEATAWKERGWDGVAPVTRVEFEVRGEALDELELRHPVPGRAGGAEHARRFAAALDGLWAYLTKEWLRLERRGVAGVLQPRWRAVQDVTFERAAAPRARQRRRGTAKAAQSRGATLSFLAAEGRLPNLWPSKVTSDGAVDAERKGDDAREIAAEMIGRSTPEAERAARAKAEVYRIVQTAYRIAGRAVAAAELEKATSPEQALASVLTRCRGALARCAAPPDPLTSLIVEAA